MYDQLARYYDLIHSSLTKDVSFVMRLAHTFGGPVLELGCGTGRVALPLVRAGFNITGIDNSLPMLNRARSLLALEPEEVQARVELIEADMTAFELPGHTEAFRLAVVSHNTWMHLPKRAMSSALQRIGRYLGPGSRLFLDLMNPFVIAMASDSDSLTRERQFIDPKTGDHVFQYSLHKHDAANQVLHVTWVVETQLADGAPGERISAEMDYHYLFPHQAELMLNRAGYRLLRLSGNYEDEAFTETSERLLVLAGRPQQ